MSPPNSATYCKYGPTLISSKYFTIFGGCSCEGRGRGGGGVYSIGEMYSISCMTVVV